MIPHTGIHHVSLNVRDLERSVVFYRDVIGLRPIERPPFQSVGAWFAVGETDDGQQLHLIEFPGETLREGRMDSRDGHFAIRVASFRQMTEWLDRQAIPYEARPSSTAGFPQIYVLDPDHNIIEFNAERLD